MGREAHTQAACPKKSLTNDGVVVGVEVDSSRLHAGLEFHMGSPFLSFLVLGALDFTSRLTARRAKVHRTMVLWFGLGRPALIRVCSFIGFLLSSQPPDEISGLCCCENIGPKLFCRAMRASALGQPPAASQLPSTRRSRKNHDRRFLSCLHCSPARGEGRGCCLMNRDVVVGSDLACPDLSLELHNRSPSRFCPCCP